MGGGGVKWGHPGFWANISIFIKISKKKKMLSNFFKTNSKCMKEIQEYKNNLQE